MWQKVNLFVLLQANSALSIRDWFFLSICGLHIEEQYIQFRNSLILDQYWRCYENENAGSVRRTFQEQSQYSYWSTMIVRWEKSQNRLYWSQWNLSYTWNYPSSSCYHGHGLKLFQINTPTLQLFKKTERVICLLGAVPRGGRWCQHPK